MANKVYEVKLNNVRLSFARLFTPKAYEEGQKPRYEATFLLDPSNKEHAATIDQIKKLSKEALLAKFGGEANIPKGLKKCYGLADKDEKEYDGWKGMFYIATAKSPKKDQAIPEPVILIDRQRNPVKESDGILYSGCYVNAKISLWVVDHPKRKGISANLQVVQYYAKGAAFGAKPVDVEEEFDAYDEEAADATETETETAGWDD